MNALRCGLFTGMDVGDVNISHLFYADDTIFVGQWSKNNVYNIVRVLQCFLIASRLRINLHKSKLIGVGSFGGLCSF